MITSPSPPNHHAPEAHKILMVESGNEFNKAFVDMMVSGLKDAIAVIEKASTDYNDPDIYNLATTSLPDMRTHLDYLIDCQKKCDNM